MIVSNVKAVLKDIKVTKKGINVTLENVNLQGDDLQTLAELIDSRILFSVDVEQMSLFEDEDVNELSPEEVELPEVEENIEYDGGLEETELPDQAEGTEEVEAVEEGPKPEPFVMDSSEEDVLQELGLE
jgi:hypothetical protein